MSYFFYFNDLIYVGFFTKITVIRVKLMVLDINSDASFKIELRKKCYYEFILN